MATVTPTVTEVNPGTGQAAWKAVWALIGDSDTCVASPITLAPYTDRSVQISGTFNSATVKLQGSNDGTNYLDLTDPQGNAISKTSAGLEQVEEATIYVKPVSSGGTSSSTTVTVYFSGYRNR